MKALQRELAHRLGRDGVLYGGQRLGRRQDLAPLRLRAEARREVDDASDSPVIEAALEADSSHRRESHRDADPQRQIVAPLAPADDELGDPLLHRQRHPHRSKRCVFDGEGIVEEHHQGVAGETFQGPAEGVDQLPQLTVELRQDGHHLLRFRGLRERGEAPEVAEHHRDLASMALQHALVVVVHDQLGELWRQEAPHAAQALEILDLGTHTVFQRPIPLGKLRRLALDRVVELLDPKQGPDTR